MGTNEYYKARGIQNFKGRTIEHIVCMHKQHPIVDEIDPRPDTPDYYGSLPFYYTLQQDDLPMIEKQFKGGRQYFSMRNYKYESPFHIAAKNNALASLKFICGKSCFIDQLLKRDFEGNTPIHSAAKAGSLEILEWLCSFATKVFLEIQNDFGFTPLQAA
jgi:ankyrin repeat protein